MYQLSLEDICLSFCRDTALEILALRQPSKEFSCKMTENMQVDALPSRQAGFVRCCLSESIKLKDIPGYLIWEPEESVNF